MAVDVAESLSVSTLLRCSVYGAVVAACKGGEFALPTFREKLLQWPVRDLFSDRISGFVLPVR